MSLPEVVQCILDPTKMPVKEVVTGKVMSPAEQLVACQSMEEVENLVLLHYTDENGLNLAKLKEQLGDKPPTLLLTRHIAGSFNYGALATDLVESEVPFNLLNDTPLDVPSFLLGTCEIEVL